MIHNRPTSPEVLSVVQAAERLGLSPRTVLYRIKTGKIAASKLGPGTAAYVITRDEVERVRSIQRNKASA